MHLPPAVYSALQNFVISGDQIAEIIDLLGVRPGSRVLELGCGTGLLAAPFIERGYEYWGIDPDSERIDWAKKAKPQGHFLVADALDFKLEDIGNCKHIFIHNVLHHLTDEECHRLMDRILALDKDIVFVITEPKRPAKWWHNPLGTLLCNMDEGKYVRTLPQWESLFEGRAKTLRVKKKMHWPVSILHAKLTH